MMGRIYDMAIGNIPLAELKPNSSPADEAPFWRKFIFSRKVRRQSDNFYKSLGRNIEAMMEAEEQHSKVEMTFDHLSSDSASGVREKPAFTFGYLRGLVANCEPANAIIETLLNMAGSYCQFPDIQGGYVSKPGFRIKLRKSHEEATEEDRDTISEIEEFMLNCGYCEPPIDNRPEGYQKGMQAWVRGFLRDSLTLDWCATRFWRADPKVDREGKYPITCFSYWDAARIRKVRRKNLPLTDGIIRTENWEGKREEYRKEETVLVEVNSDGPGGIVVDEFKDREMKTGIRNSRTDTLANGYGYAELERCINAISYWIYARDYNGSRFRLDSLPRGILTILGNMNETQFQMFKLEWMQLLQGLGKRWTIPILKGAPTANSAVNWLGLDQSSRDMEYHQFMFSVSLWLHAAFKVHPEETGYEALSPFRPPLSEASPETKIEYSQDKGFHPLMIWLQNWINENILWVMRPDRRYIFEWVGLGDYDRLQEAQYWGEMLQNGQATPAEYWKAADKPMPKIWAGHPAWDTPAPFMVGVAYWDNIHTQEQQAQMMQAAPPGGAIVPGADNQSPGSPSPSQGVPQSQQSPFPRPAAQALPTPFPPRDRSMGGIPQIAQPDVGIGKSMFAFYTPIEERKAAMNGR